MFIKQNTPALIVSMFETLFLARKERKEEIVPCKTLHILASFLTAAAPRKFTLKAEKAG